MFIDKTERRTVCLTPSDVAAYCIDGLKRDGHIPLATDACDVRVTWYDFNDAADESTPGVTAAQFTFEVTDREML